MAELRELVSGYLAGSGGGFAGRERVASGALRGEIWVLRRLGLLYIQRNCGGNEQSMDQ